MIDWEATEGDDGAVMTVTLQDKDGQPVDLSSATTVTLTMGRPYQDPVIDAQPVQVEDQNAHRGQVTYVWSAAELSTPGDLLGFVLVVDPATTTTYPTYQITARILPKRPGRRPIVSVDDVTEYLGLQGASSGASPTFRTAVAAIIDGLQGDLRAYLKRPLVEESFVESTPDLRISHRGRAYLKGNPVRSVQSIDIDGVVIDPVDYVVQSWGIDQLLVWVVGSLPVPVLTVRYTAGLHGDDPNDDFGAYLVGALTRKAGAVVNKVLREDQAGIRSMTVEGTSYVWDTSETWSEDELKRFSRWRKRIVR